MHNHKLLVLTALVLIALFLAAWEQGTGEGGGPYPDPDHLIFAPGIWNGAYPPIPYPLPATVTPWPTRTPAPPPTPAPLGVRNG